METETVQTVMRKGDLAYPVMDEIACVHCGCSASVVSDLAADLSWDAILQGAETLENPVCCEVC